MIVGTLGAAAMRLDVVTAIARKRPLLNCGIVTPTLPNRICTWPAIVSVSAGPVPLYGM